MTETADPVRTEEAPPPPAPATQKAVFFSAFKLLTAIALTLAAAFATVLAIFFFVPDDSDYARVSILKHDRLSSVASPRIVLIGASNLAYGIDSRQLESLTGCPIVNMGMNGYFGVRYMFNEVRDEMRPGDIAVLAFEYDSFYKSIDGTATDLAMVTKANPNAFQWLTNAQRARLSSGIVYAAQQKVFRLMRETPGELRALITGQPVAVDPETDIYVYETYAGFTPEGDLTSHLDAHWAGEHEDGMDATKIPVDPGILPLIEQFNNDMNARGVTVLMSQTPIMDAYYNRHRAALESLDRQIRAIPGLKVVARPPDGYVFPRSMMFDTDYHLNRAGRAQRTAMLAQDILPYTRDVCPGAQASSQGDQP